MVDYPAMQNTGNLRKFIQEIPQRKVPEKVTQKYIEQCGYKSTKDRPIQKVLEFIGFVDSTGKPKEHFESFRDKRRAGAVMAKRLVAAYSDLFDVQPDACQADSEALANFFRPETGASEVTVNNMVATFKVLCEFSDFKAEPMVLGKPEETQEKVATPRKMITTAGVIPININIQLVLPETADVRIYDELFKSLKKHLLSESSDE